MYCHGSSLVRTLAAIAGLPSEYSALVAEREQRTVEQVTLELETVVEPALTDFVLEQVLRRIPAPVQISPEGSADMPENRI